MEPSFSIKLVKDDAAEDEYRPRASGGRDATSGAGAVDAGGFAGRRGARAWPVTFRTKLSILFVALLCVTMTVSYVISSRATQARLLEEFVSRSESFAEGIAAAAGYGLLSKDLLGLDSIVSRTRDVNLDVRYVAVADAAMRVVVHSDAMYDGARLPPATGTLFRRSAGGSFVYQRPHDVLSVLEVRSPVRFMERELGSVVLGIDRAVLVERQREAGRSMLATYAGVLALGITGIIALAGHLARPLRALSLGVEQLKRGAVRRPLAILAPDELGRLTGDFNELSATLYEQRDAISGHSRELEGAYVSTVRVITAAIEARDPYTHGHSSRVARVSVEIGRRLGLLKAELDDLVIASLFHDVGKIRTPDSILRKPGRLTSMETREMMRHPHHGAEILGHAAFLLKYVPSVLHHHEWYDGAGYPDGARGDRIPLGASIISLADAFDAMTSDRPYRRALTAREATEEIASLSGRQFRPALVAAFLAADVPC